MVLIFVSRFFQFAKNHFNPNQSNALGLVFVFLAVAIVLIISKLTYQWIEKPYQKEFRDVAAKRFNI
jgi:peptidoglycan/LPS O-acetylase OafA/YrhL